MQTPTRPSQLPAAIAVCCVGVAAFSLMDALMKGVSIALGAYNALLWRCVAGGALGGLAMLATRNPWPKPSVLRLHALRSTVVAFMGLLFFWGLARVPIAEAIALSFIAPLVALYLASLLLGERVGRSALIASLMGLAGMVVILAGKQGGRFGDDAFWGVVAVLVSALLYAWNLVLQRQQAQIASPVEIAFFQSGMIALVLLPAAPWAAHLPAVEQGWRIAASAALAFVALVTLSWGYARAEAQYVLPTEYTAFLWAALFGWLFFAEPLAWTTVAGAALIVAACLIAARAEPRRAAAHVEPAAL